MIAALGTLLFAFLTPASLSANGPLPVAQGPSRQSASTLSFDQIAESAVRAWGQNRDEEAIRLFKQGLDIKPEWNEGLWYLGTIYYEKERFREARELLRRYVAENPSQGPPWALVGLCDYKLREYGRALDHLQRAISLGLSGRKQLENAVLYHRAILLIREGQYDSAMNALYHLRSALVGQGQPSLDIPAGLAVAGYQLLPEEIPAGRREFVEKMGAAAFARIGKRSEAMDILREVVKQYPDERAPHYQLGSLLLEAGDPAGIAEMQKVLEISPSSAEARLKLAEYYLARSQQERARLYVNEALNLEPDHPLAHLLNGQILDANGDLPRAIKELETARELAPQEGRVLWALMRAYRAAGRPEEAARVKADIAKIGADVDQGK